MASASRSSSVTRSAPSEAASHLGKTVAAPPREPLLHANSKSERHRVQTLVRVTSLVAARRRGHQHRPLGLRGKEHPRVETCSRRPDVIRRRIVARVEPNGPRHGPALLVDRAECHLQAGSPGLADRDAAETIIRLLACRRIDGVVLKDQYVVGVKRDRLKIPAATRTRRGSVREIENQGAATRLGSQVELAVRFKITPSAGR